MLDPGSHDVFQGHKKLVLEGIINFFTEMDMAQRPASELELR